MGFSQGLSYVCEGLVYMSPFVKLLAWCTGMGKACDGSGNQAENPWI